jgi:Right handed beta helix region
MSNSGSGVLIKPAAGGRVTATFNGVTIADNMGGGLKTDSTNGLIEVEMTNSTISNNAGNGLNAVGGAGGSNMLNLGHNVIAANGSAGIQANGGTAAVFVDTTLLDLNAIGISAVNSGKVFTYGNNRIIGTPGSPFTSSAALQ